MSQQLFYAIDMEAAQHSTLIGDLPPAEIVVTMGCNVNCPYLPSKHREDWGLDDPTGRNEAEFRRTVAKIEDKVKDLAKRIMQGSLNI